MYIVFSEQAPIKNQTVFWNVLDSTVLTEQNQIYFYRIKGYKLK